MRIELTTLGLLDPRSNQLSYESWLCEQNYYIALMYFNKSFYCAVRTQHPYFTSPPLKAAIFI